MYTTQREIMDAGAMLKAAQRVVILSHRAPDGDTVGSNLALRRVLKEQWNKEVISACIDPLFVSDQWLLEANTYVRDFDLGWPDLIVTVDCGAHYMTKFHESKPTLFAGTPPVINIDHHASNDRFGKINIVEDTAASATQIVYELLKMWGATVDRHIATALLHGLYFDTGSFMHSNTTPRVLEIASELMWKGADVRTISRTQFGTMSIPQLKLYGRMLERAHVSTKGVAVAALTRDDFVFAGAESSDMTGAIDYLNSIPEGKLSCLLYEDKNGILKGSLRTRDDDINVSELAGIFGGGGHRKASGFSMPGRIEVEATNSKISIV